jgi:hypothetical protein
MKDGDRFLQELAQARHEADMRQRLAIFKELMANADNDICPECGADRLAYREMMGEDCWHGH